MVRSRRSSCIEWVFSSGDTTKSQYISGNQLWLIPYFRHVRPSRTSSSVHPYSRLCACLLNASRIFHLLVSTWNSVVRFCGGVDYSPDCSRQPFFHSRACNSWVQPLSLLPGVVYLRRPLMVRTLGCISGHSLSSVCCDCRICLIRFFWAVSHSSCSFPKSLHQFPCATCRVSAFLHQGSLSLSRVELLLVSNFPLIVFQGIFCRNLAVLMASFANGVLIISL